MKKVVIIGGGFAGSYCAKHLEKDFQTTLIDTKDYFEFTPSIIRALVEPKHISKIIVSHKHYLKKTKVIKGEAKEISPGKVLANGKERPYDYLIICSGSKYNAPIKEKHLLVISRLKGIKESADKLNKARSVLIIGGGLVGVELAGEIIERYPEKEVTLIHAQSHLMERSPEKAQDYAERFLARKKVKIILNQVASDRNGEFVTNKDIRVKADLAFWCTGITPNYEYLKQCSSSLNERNYLCVNEHLQVSSYQNIFAGGDITDVQEEKTAQNAEEQAKVIVKNIIHLENNEPLGEYKTKPRIMVISLGQKNGMITYKNLLFTGYLAGIMKRLIELKTMRRFK